jgi:hypothetical protein
MPRKQKLGSMQRFMIRDAETGQSIRDKEGKPLVIAAYTAKAAKHQAKGLSDRQIITERL